jgi:hypothetical protein
MVVTKKCIQELREISFMKISAETEKIILEKHGKEPGPDENGCRDTYTEQDLWE